MNESSSSIIQDKAVFYYLTLNLEILILQNNVILLSLQCTEAILDMSAAIMSEETKMETAPFDPRFPNQNQTRYCYQSFVDFNRCQKIKGEDYEPCEYFKKVYTTICPNSWIEKWTDQIENGIFPGKI